ncbi:DUF1257 domain-containing protein [Cyanobium sp. ATX 6A2]|jgi:hypothetical protein|uniref:DUF1257 domain-containing protein n=1 Tax=Cyanobium sp. ATX 6A2 TaxID=2823700 RepID=UPI0020CE7EDD|nr:DUF1257 domain-containing protein [Cyanobium sp. ATX 6A2]MCP9887267.1 DUF1257 domain-containing protein [Cyanobium sp. ATX 6A2]
MSHLSILPTVLRDADRLVASLVAIGLQPHWGGQLDGFADDCQAVELQVQLEGGQRLGWARQADGSLALVGDLQRISRSTRLQGLLSAITRRYAAEKALADAASQLASAQVSVRS